MIDDPVWQFKLAVIQTCCHDRRLGLARPEKYGRSPARRKL